MGNIIHEPFILCGIGAGVIDDEDVAVAVELFKAGAKDYVVKGIGAWKKIGNMINDAITKPIRVFIRGFFR